LVEFRLLWLLYRCFLLFFVLLLGVFGLLFAALFYALAHGVPLFFFWRRFRVRLLILLWVLVFGLVGFLLFLLALALLLL
jgi:hypothetical protein